MSAIFENFRSFTRFLGKQPQNNQIFNFIRFCRNFAQRCIFHGEFKNVSYFSKFPIFLTDFWENSPNITKFSTSSDFDEILHTSNFWRIIQKRGRFLKIYVSPSDFLENNPNITTFSTVENSKIWTIFENFCLFAICWENQNDHIFNSSRYSWNFSHSSNLCWIIQKWAPLLKIFLYSADFWENNPKITNFSTSSNFYEILHIVVIFGGEFKNADHFFTRYWKNIPKNSKFSTSSDLMKFCE